MKYMIALCAFIGGVFILGASIGSVLYFAYTYDPALVDWMVYSISAVALVVLIVSVGENSKEQQKRAKDESGPRDSSASR